MSEIEQWYMINKKPFNLSVGDLPKLPTLERSSSINLLRYYSKLDIGQSSDLESLMGAKFVSVKKIVGTVAKETYDFSELLLPENDEVTPEDQYLWDDLRVPIFSTNASSANAPVFTLFRNDGSPAVGKSAIMENGQYGTISYDASIDLPDEMTISVWAKPETGGGFGGLTRMILDRDGHFSISSNGNKENVKFNIDGLGTISSNTGVMPMGTWSHICAVLSKDTAPTPDRWDMTLYVNGVVVASSSATTSPNNSDNTIYVGERSSTGRYWGGNFDELAFYSSALTNTQVQGLYNNGNGTRLEGTEANLVSLYHFDDDAFDSAGDNDMTFLNAEYGDGWVGGEGTVGVFCYAFDSGVREEVFFTAQMSHAYKYGTQMRPHLHWAPSDDSSGSVVWGLEYTIAPFGSAFGTTVINTCTAEAGGVAYEHTYASLGQMDPQNSLSFMIVGRIFRDGTDSNDTYNAPAYLLEFDIHYVSDSLGSEKELKKD